MPTITAVLLISCCGVLFGGFSETEVCLSETVYFAEVCFSFGHGDCTAMVAL